MSDAALSEVVKYAQGLYEEGDQPRQVRKKVTEAITRWASTEGFIDEEIEHGLALATRTVARFGLSNEGLAEFKFDPAQAAGKVVASAKKKDRYWGTENHYEVASRSIQVTYDALIKQLQANHDVLIPVFQALRDRIDARAAEAKDMAETTHTQLSDLVEALVAVSTESEVMSYLQTRVDDWNVSVWHQDRQAAALERLLRVCEQSDPATGGEYLTAEEALEHQQMLVVLGGPGAGKTWLARRFARQAAQAALSQLEDEASLEEVELPLLTTWEQWVKARSGSPRESLVEAAFAADLGHSDLGDGDIVGRLRRLFLRPQARVLLVVDSLDEAADHTAQTPRLHVLRGLPAGWRVVVTSRPTAWDATYRGNSSRTLEPRVVTLCDLTYPEDVQAFIRGWFVQAADPARGEALIREIRDRAELAQFAVVPLMLTFYCLLAEKSKAVAEPLPTRRRDLYRLLTRRLLYGEWIAGHPRLDAGPDWHYREELLMSWAWQAVRNRTNAVGLGVWNDSFTEPTIVREAERRAIDHMVPKTAVDDEGNITRRFVHRTFLEHFVAEHIATLDASEAADLLLPHLWFDPDWKVAAPAAIIAHNQKQPGGALLQHLLDRAVLPAPDPARQRAGGQLDQLLLNVAQETEPHKWSPEHQDVLHKCRTSNATKNPGLVTRSAHWTHSNQNARTVVLEALPTAAPGDIPGLVEVLVRLELIEAERVQAYTVVLQRLSTVASGDVPYLVDALVRLEPTEVERVQTRTVVLQRLSIVAPGYHLGLVDALVRLVTTETERKQVRAVVLQGLPTVASGDVPYWVVDALAYLVDALVRLEPTEVEQIQVRTVVLQVLATAEPWDVPNLVDALVKLEPTDAESDQARTVVLQALPAADRWEVLHLVDALVGLEPTEAEWDQARTVVLQALPTVALWDVSYLVDALVRLEPTEVERAQARTVVLQALPTAAPRSVRSLVNALVELVITEAQRVQACTVVLQALPTAAPGDIEYLVDALMGLVATETERNQARTVVLQVLDSTEPWVFPYLVDALVRLEPTEVERDQARTVMLQMLQVLAPIAPWAVQKLVEVLVGLEPTEDQRDQACTVVLQALPAADRWEVPGMVYALVGLVNTEAQRVQTRAAVLQALPTAALGSVQGLVEMLVGLEPTEAERDQARTVVLQALPTAGRKEVEGLVEALRAVSPVKYWLAWLSGSQVNQ